VSKVTKNVITFLIFSLVLSFVLLFIALYVYYGRTVEDEYLITSPLRNILVMRLALSQGLTLLPPLVLFNFIAAFSIYYTLSPFQTESFSFASVAAPSFVILLTLILFTVLTELFFIPEVNKQAERTRFNARLLHKIPGQARELKERGRLRDALDLLDLYTEADRNNQEVNELNREILDELDARGILDTRSRTEETGNGEPPETSLEKGNQAYERGDYYVALFYFERALALHGDNREIQELYERARKQTRDLLGSLTESQQENRWLVQNKTRAIDFMESGRYYEAYDIFSLIHDRYPQLTDINLYLEQVEEELAQIDFLPQNMTEHAWLPSYDHVLFFDRGGNLNAVERIVSWQGDYFFYGISRYRNGTGSSVDRWSYGKWLDGRIRLKNEMEFTRVAEGEEDRHFITPHVPPGYLALMSDSALLEKQLTFYERTQLAEGIFRSGVDIDSNARYIAREAGVIFSIYVLSLVFSAMAWAKRSIYEFPPFFKLLIFIVTVPVLAFIAHRLYVSANDLLMYTHRYVLRVIGGMNVAVFVIVVQAVISFAATFYFLTQRSGVE
jgi:tetratricopeptide (TPR) repeat protein